MNGRNGQVLRTRASLRRTKVLISLRNVYDG